MYVAPTPLYCADALVCHVKLSPVKNLPVRCDLLSKFFDDFFLGKSKIIFDLHMLCLTSNKHDDDDDVVVVVVAVVVVVVVVVDNDNDDDADDTHLSSSHLLFFKKQLSNATVYKLIHIYTYTYNKMLRSQIIYNSVNI